VRVLIYGCDDFILSTSRGQDHFIPRSLDNELLDLTSNLYHNIGSIDSDAFGQGARQDSGSVNDWTQKTRKSKAFEAALGQLDFQTHEQQRDIPQIMESPVIELEMTNLCSNGVSGRRRLPDCRFWIANAQIQQIIRNHWREAPGRMIDAWR
jgi:hypothetical protein